MGVRTARVLAVWNIASSYPLFFRSLFSTVFLLFRQIRYFQIVPLIFIFLCPANVIRLSKNALHTQVIPMIQNSGRPLLKISVVEISAAPAEMAGAPWITAS